MITALTTFRLINANIPPGTQTTFCFFEENIIYKKPDQIGLEGLFVVMDTLQNIRSPQQ